MSQVSLRRAVTRSQACLPSSCQPLRQRMSQPQWKAPQPLRLLQQWRLQLSWRALPGATLPWLPQGKAQARPPACLTCWAPQASFPTTTRCHRARAARRKKMKRSSRARSSLRPRAPPCEAVSPHETLPRALLPHQCPALASPSQPCPAWQDQRAAAGGVPQAVPWPLAPAPPTAWEAPTQTRRCPWSLTVSRRTSGCPLEGVYQS